MSHFTYIKTRFQNLVYLKKALTRLHIVHKEQEQKLSSEMSLIIPQSNGYDINFNWNGEEYELVVDLSFWKQPYPIESFIDKLSQQYASEAVINESKKLGFQPVQSKQNLDGSNTLILERWKS